MRHIQKMLLFLFHAAEWCIIAVAMTLIVLMLFGIHPYVVKTGSMEPAIKVESICFVNQQATYEDVCEGDIIAFKVSEMLVTHRAVRIDENGITTKGDANNIEDTAKVTKDNFIGRIVYWLPWIGKVPLFLHTRRGKIILVDVVLVFVVSLYFENRLNRKNDCKDDENENDSNAQASSSTDDALL